VLPLKKTRPKITPVKIGIALIGIIVIWFVLQYTIATMETVYSRLLLLCILGFGFLAISWMLKYN
jgi:hypothetical protein